MKVSNATAYGYVEQLAGLKETGKLGFAIAKNMRKLGNELVEFEQKRSELFQKYGTDNNDGTYSIPNEKLDDFMAEYNEYATIEFEFEPTLIDEDAFCSGTLTSDQMYKLDWMVKEEEKTEE